MTTTPSSLPVGQLIELDGSPPAAHLLNADPGPPPKDLLCGSPRLPDGGRLEGILLPTKDGESIPSSKPAPPPRPPPRRGSTSTSAGHRNTTTNPNHRGNVPMTSNRREDIKRSLDRQGDIKGEEVGSQKVEREQPKGRPRTMESGTNGDIEVAGLVGQKVSGSESEATESADSDDADEGGKVDEEEKEDKEGIVMAAEGLLGLCKSLGPGIDCSEQSENERGGSAEERDFLRVFVTGIFEGSMTEEDAASFAEICKGKHCEGRAWFAHFTTAQAPADGSISSGAFHHLVEACTIVLNGCEQHADYVPAVCLLPLCFTCYRPVPENQGGLDAYLRTGRAWLAGSGGRLKSLFGSFGSSQSSQQEQMEKEAAAGDVEGGTNLEDENKDFLYNHLQELPVWRTSRFWSAAFFTVTHHSPLTEPSSPSQEDGGMTSSLRLLTKRMVLLGVGRKHCTELIRKHAAMGHLQPEQLDELIRSVDEATSP